MKHNPLLKATFLEVVENQLREDNPPETGMTLQRLRSLGYSMADTKILIASAIAAEVFEVLKSNKPSDPSRYIRYLNQLPDQSFDEATDKEKA